MGRNFSNAWYKQQDRLELRNSKFGKSNGVVPSMGNEINTQNEVDLRIIAEEILMRWLIEFPEGCLFEL